jgi:hypothetical protein
MSPPFTPEQHVASSIDRMSASTETSAAAAHGILNASIVWSLALPALAFGTMAAVLQPLIRPPSR